MTGPVISNTSPLISLQRIGRLDLLRELYGEIVIPSAVLKELGSRFRMADWIVECPISPPLPPVVMHAGLGSGESEAISLAIETKARLLLLDDGPARGLAFAAGLPTGGTLGVLLQAKNQGIIREVKPLLDQLILKEFRVSQALCELVLRRAEES